jgi:hypothetical protein
MPQTTTSVEIYDAAGVRQNFVVERDSATGTFTPHHVTTAPVIASTALEGSHVFAVGEANVFAVTATGLSAFAWLMLFDAAAVPADGPVTPLAAIQATSLAVVQIAWGGVAASLGAGVVAVLSTTGPFTKTAGPTGFLSALVA